MGCLVPGSTELVFRVTDSAVVSLQSTVHSMINAGSIDVRYPCNLVHQILSTDWVRFLGLPAPHDDSQNLAPGLKAMVVSRLRACNSARVNAAVDTEAITPTVLHAGPISLFVITQGLIPNIGLAYGHGAQMLICAHAALVQE